MPLVSDRNPAPIRERYIATLFEAGSSTELAIEVEVIVDDGVNGDEFLQGNRPSESLHGPLSSPERLMGILGPVVQPSCSILPPPEAQHCQGCPVRSEAVGNDFSR